MKYDFTSVIDRTGKDSIAWENIPVPNAEIAEGFDRIPMWVADMNFQTAPSVCEAITKRLEHQVFGYFNPSEDYYNSIINWQKVRNGVEGLTKEAIGYENGVLGGVVAALQAFSAQKVFPESYDHYRQVIRDKYEYYRIQTNTLIKVGKEIGLASVRNMRFLPDCRSGAEYKNYFPQDIPAIIVAAGPSLKKNVNLLKEVKGKAVTIVVDSAINTVMAHGIVPDFAITVDTNKELKNFTAEGLSDVFLLADATANTKALDMVKSKNLVFYSSDSATWQRMFREEGSSITEVFAGGSVALDAMALAKEWGFKRIIMIGQDLAMTGNKQYADGEKLNQNTSFNSPTLYVKDIYGNDVLTKKDYYTFIRSIEDLAYRNPDIDFIDATEGGAFKKHTRIMTLQEAIDTYCTVGYDVTGRIEAVPRLFEEEGKKKVLDNLSLMREHVQTLTDKMAVGAQDCTLAAHMLETGKFDKEVLKKINERNRELDAYYADMEEHILVKKISAQANYDFGKEVYQTLQDDIQESIRLYKNSAKLYQGIADSTDCIIDEIAKVESEIANE